MLQIRQDATDDSAGSIATSLLQRVKARDPLAWQRLAQLYGPLVYRWCLRANLQAADAEDVVPEVFARLAPGIAGFRREQPGDTFRGWLWTITRHKLSCNEFEERSWQAFWQVAIEGRGRRGRPVGHDHQGRLHRQIASLSQAAG